MAVRLVLLLLECAFIELALAERADKVLRVELAVHSGDTASGDWLVAPSTQ